MKIKNLVVIFLVIIVSLVSIFSFFEYIFLQEVASHREDRRQIVEINSKVSELLLLSNKSLTENNENNQDLLAIYTEIEELFEDIQADDNFSQADSLEEVKLDFNELQSIQATFFQKRAKLENDLTTLFDSSDLEQEEILEETQIIQEEIDDLERAFSDDLYRVSTDTINDIDILAKQALDGLIAAEEKGSINTSSFIVLVVLFGVFVSLFLLQISRKLGQLVRVLNDISRGQLNTKIDDGLIRRSDEIGDLARSFDRVIVSLKLAIRDQQPSGSKQQKPKSSVEEL